MTLNFDPHAPVNKVAVVLYCLALIPSYAVVFFCTYEAVENKWMRYHAILSRAAPDHATRSGEGHMTGAATTATTAATATATATTTAGAAAAGEEREVSRVEYLRSSPAHVRARYILHRWGWVLVSAAVAASIPRFGDYLGLIGALANSTAIYIMPQACWLRVCAPRAAGRGPLDTLWVGACYAVIVFGVVLVFMGTIQSGEGLFSSHNDTGM